MPNFYKQRAARRRLKFSAMGKASQRVQAARRLESAAAIERDLAEIEILNYPRRQGDPIGSLQWTDFRTGRIRRWTVRIGDRLDRITLQSPDGRATQSHGWAWVMVKLRKAIIGRSDKHKGTTSSV